MLISKLFRVFDRDAKAHTGAGRGIDGTVLRDNAAGGTRFRGAGDNRCTARAAAYDGRRERRPLDAVPDVRHADEKNNVRPRRPLSFTSRYKPLQQAIGHILVTPRTATGVR